MLKRLLLSLIILSGSLFATESDLLFDSWIKNYNELLKENVTLGKKEGIETTLVDYQGIRSNPKFRKLIYDLARLPKLETLSESDQLAMWINAYNIIVIKLIVENPKITSIKQLDSPFKRIWKQKLGIVAGSSYSLDEIEHGIIRTRFKEPRIHFVVNCASISCPDLANYAYEGEHLNHQLNHQTKRFLSNPTKGLSLKGEVLYLSKLFKWYGEDFTPDVKGWLMSHGYLSDKGQDYKVKYMTYNWALNSQ